MSLLWKTDYDLGDHCDLMFVLYLLDVFAIICSSKVNFDFK